MAIDNFEQIRGLLSFNSEDEFYFVQIIQRKKDNPGKINGSNNSSRLIKAYYIKSLEELDKHKEEMIKLSELFNARVGINLNKRSLYKTAFNTMKKIADLMHNKDFSNIARAYNTCCGLHNDIDDKIWLLDVDTLDNDVYLNLVDFINKQQPINKNKIIAKIPSKSGYHVITSGFDTREFIKQFPEIEIHKNNPVNLYIPGEKSNFKINFDPVDFKKYIDRIRKKEDIETRQLERFHSKGNFKVFVEKVIEKYNSDEYRNRWYKRNIEPPYDLNWFLYHYAQKYGRMAIDDEWRQYSCDFTTDLVYCEGYFFERIDGQGSFIGIIKE